MCFATIIYKNTPTEIFMQFLGTPQKGEQRFVQIQESMDMAARKSYLMKNHLSKCQQPFTLQLVDICSTKSF